MKNNINIMFIITYFYACFWECAVAMASRQPQQALDWFGSALGIQPSGDAEMTIVWKISGFSATNWSQKPVVNHAFGKGIWLEFSSDSTNQGRREEGELCRCQTVYVIWWVTWGVVKTMFMICFGLGGMHSSDWKIPPETINSCHCWLICSPWKMLAWPSCWWVILPGTNKCLDIYTWHLSIETTQQGSKDVRIDTSAWGLPCQPGV